jgi:acetyl-CoA carboxylase biotin carboxylase subunit
MNTRLQVEHPVSEMITGVDIVKEQIRIASGQPLSIQQSEVSFTGHAIECRINAEDEHFRPAPGRISSYQAPGGFGVRMDTHIYSGYEVPHHFDSLLGKLICHGRDRAEAIARMTRALGEIRIDGVDTNIPFHRNVMADEGYQQGRYPGPGS